MLVKMFVNFLKIGYLTPQVKTLNSPLTPAPWMVLENIILSEINQ